MDTVRPTAATQPQFVAFASGRLVATGPLEVVARAAKLATDAGEPRVVQVFDAKNSEPWDLDLSGTLEHVEHRYRFENPRLWPSAAEAGVRDESADSTVLRTARPGPGRPRLGVVAREVTLLPRHWAWLSEQPGGASAALRRLVDDARKSLAPKDALRRSQQSTYRFLLATLGDAPGFEEAMRALYAGDEAGFTTHSDRWPTDLRAHARHLAHAVFHPEGH